MSDNQEHKTAPLTFKRLKLKEIGKIVSGGTPSTAIPDYWNGDISWISPADLTGYKEKRISKGAKSITESGLKNSSARLMPKGAVLFSSRAPIGYVAIADKELATNQGFKSIIPHEILDSEYLYYFLKSAKQMAENVASGTTFKEISLSKFSELEIPVPTIATQKAIVSKIEELFSELDKGIENLRLAQQQLKTYRQAVLKWAFEGRLTNENVKDGELPEGWKWKTLKEITSLLGDGLHGTPRYSEKGEFFFINGNNLSDGKIVFKDSTKRVDINEYQKHKKELNDTTILVSINGTLGNTAFFNGEKVILGKSACYFNLYPLANKHYIRYIITSQRFINYAEETATGSTIPNVSLKAMREFTVPIPSIDEQIRIVQEIESRLIVADKTDKIISDSLNRVESLRQSILKRAFQGML